MPNRRYNKKEREAKRNRRQALPLILIGTNRLRFALYKLLRVVYIREY